MSSVKEDLTCSTVGCNHLARFKVQYAPDGHRTTQTGYACSIVCLLKWASRFSVRQGQAAVQRLLGGLPK
jgi:hypothetical protein